ncbi:MAG: TPM domain-containing protein [Planctomycetaceae bacterium]
MTLDPIEFRQTTPARCPEAASGGMQTSGIERWLFPARRVRAWLFLPAAMAVCCFGSAAAQEFDLQPPGDREFISDHADLIAESSEAKIRKVCQQLLSDKATPILVVTIESMGQHGGANMSIEAFAAVLFNKWQIGHATLNGRNWNTGILLLVSKGDRRARIELGAGWDLSENDTCQRIMDEYIIPQFRAGDYSGGIVAGVEALDKMARKLELPSRPRPASHYVLMAVFVGLAIFTAVSLYRRGSSGWAWVFWGVVFTVVGTVLYHALRSRGGSSSGGFGGGSFGGGFSGGGGASGSW